MDNQRFTILITLVSSVTVVLISSTANILSKWIDNKQKKQDRALEFNKIYAARKIEAGESIIGSNNLLITQARYMKDILTAYVSNYGYYHKTGFTKVDADIEKANGLMLTDKAAYRLYFEADNHSENVAKAAFECNRLMNILISKLAERKLLVSDIDPEDRILVKRGSLDAWNNSQVESEQLLTEYLEANANFQSSLVDSCNHFRMALRKYDMEG